MGLSINIVIARNLARDILGDIRLIEDCLKAGEIESAYEKSFELDHLCERLVLTAREMPCLYGKPKALSIVLDQIPDLNEIEIGYTEEDWLKVTLPRLLPKKNRKGSTHYIRDTLYPSMIAYSASHPIKRLDDCVIIFRHVYDSKEPQKAWRDHDNIEIKQVTDIIAFFAMKDDGPRICSHFYCSAAGDANKTEVYVVPSDQLTMWLEKYRK